MTASIKLLLSNIPDHGCRAIAGTLDKAGFNTEIAMADGRSALRHLLSEKRFDLAMGNPKVNGHVEDQTLDDIRELAPETPYLALGQDLGHEAGLKVVEAGAQAYLNLDELDRLPGAVAACLRVAGLLRDKQRIHRDLGHFRSHFRHLFEHTPEAVVIMDQDHFIVDCNKGFTALFQYEPAEISGLTLGQTVVPEHLQDEFQDNASKVSTGTMVRQETTRMRKDGTMVHVSVVGCPVFLEDGQVGAFAIYSDITANIRAIEALRRAESKYRTIFENALEGMYISTPSGRFVSVNPAMAELLGFDSPNMVADTVKDIRSEIYARPERRDEFSRLMRKHGQAVNFVSEIRRRDGSVVTVRENVRAIHDDDGDLLYYQGTMTALD